MVIIWYHKGAEHNANQVGATLRPAHQRSWIQSSIHLYTKKDNYAYLVYRTYMRVASYIHTKQ